MSGKHVKIRALRSGVGTPVLSVGIGLVAWVVIGLALVLLPHPLPAQVGGSTQAGSAPSEADGATLQDRSPSAELPAREGALRDADGSPSAQSRTGAGGLEASSEAGAQSGSSGSSAPPAPSAESGTAAGTGASTGSEESTPPPWADAPGKAKGHDKRPARDRDEP